MKLKTIAASLMLLGAATGSAFAATANNQGGRNIQVATNSDSTWAMTNQYAGVSRELNLLDLQPGVINLGGYVNGTATYNSLSPGEDSNDRSNTRLALPKASLTTAAAINNNAVAYVQADAKMWL